MKTLWDFPGGIHPPENKRQSTRDAIRPMPLPAYLILPLQQHIGAPAKPCVAVGDTVVKGQLLAEANGPVSATLHAPTSGTIIGLEDRLVPHPSGMSDRCLILKPDGLDTWRERSPLDPFSQEPEDLLEKIRQSGICGLGGAGFPTAVKLSTGQRVVETLIINAAECEPYITADDSLLREYSQELIAGLDILVHVLQPERVIIGIEDNKPEAVNSLKVALRGKPYQLTVIPTKYPSGGEKQLIQILTGQEVPYGGIPLELGIVCQNVGTVVAIYRALCLDEPLISRITTVTGEGVERPGNYEVLLGTPISHLLKEAGFLREKTRRVVMGGPMMGFQLPDLDVPVVKTTNCILAASEAEFPEPEPEQACIRCGFCAEVCPARLLPQQLYWFSRSEQYEKAELYHLDDCIECGACAYVCPSHIPLVQYYRHAKGEIRRLEAEQSRSDHARERFEARQARLEREKAEKEAKRKARAEAAAAAQRDKQKDDPA